MIYVCVTAVKSDGRGESTGSAWEDADDVMEAVRLGLERFHRMWDGLGHGAAVTYRITVATDASPRRTKSNAALPLPVDES